METPAQLESPKTPSFYTGAANTEIIRRMEMWVGCGRLRYQKLARMKSILRPLTAIEVGDQRFNSDAVLTEYEFEWIWVCLGLHEVEDEEVEQQNTGPDLSECTWTVLSEPEVDEQDNMQEDEEQEEEKQEDEGTEDEVDEQETSDQEVEEPGAVLDASDEADMKRTAWVMALTCLTFLHWDHETKKSMPEVYQYVADQWVWQSYWFWKRHAHEFHGTKCENQIDDTQLLDLTLLFLRDEEKRKASASETFSPCCKQGDVCPTCSHLSPLHLAARWDLDKVGSRLLDDPNIDVNALNHDGTGIWHRKETPLEIAGWTDNVRILPLLFSRPEVSNTISYFLRNLDPDSDLEEAVRKHARNPFLNRSLTPLHLAAMLNLKTVASLLQEPSIDVNAKDHLGRSPLFYTTGRNYQYHHSLPQLLIAPGIDIDLAVACDSSGFRERIERFQFEIGVAPTTVAQNLTPMHLAAILDEKLTAKALLEKGDVDVNARDSLGRTPLWYAIGHVWGNVLDWLLLTPEIDVRSLEEPNNELVRHRAR